MNQEMNPNPEAGINPLEKYGINLTELAKEGKIDPVIGCEDEIRRIVQILSRRKKNNPVLIGEPGTGKTTVARALCEELGVYYIMINGSDEGRHIDTLRNNIKNFASTVSLTETAGHKVVIIDEADYMNPESVQPALRAFIEIFYKNLKTLI